MPSRRPALPTLLFTLLACAASVVLLKAAGVTSRHDAEIARLRTAWSAAARAEGFDPRSGRKALYAAHPTPEITLAKAAVVAPGGTAQVSLGGRFTPRTVFLVEHDAVTLGPATVAAGTFKATTSVAADALPAFVRVFAYAPVSGAWDSAGLVVIGASPAFTLTADNGWTIRLAPDAKGWVVSGDEATHGYKAEYLKPGATAPFETMTGSLRVSAQERPDTSYTFSMQPGGTGTAMAEYQALMAKMTDPNAFARMSARERAAFDKQMEEVGDRMTRELEAMTANPAAMIEKQASFGCGSISLEVGSAAISGSVGCGQKVGHLRLVGKRT